MWMRVSLSQRLSDVMDGRERQKNLWRSAGKPPLSHQPYCREKLLAPALFDGSINSAWFNTWLQEHLFKELLEGTKVYTNRFKLILGLEKLRNL